MRSGDLPTCLEHHLVHEFLARLPCACPGFHVPNRMWARDLPTINRAVFLLRCLSGYYVGIMGASSQTACPPGSYQPATTSTTCIASSPGSHAAGPAATGQVQCSSGTYQPNANASSCTSASSGFFVSGVGAISQSPCLLEPISRPLDRPPAMTLRQDTMSTRVVPPAKHHVQPDPTKRTQGERPAQPPRLATTRPSPDRRPRRNAHPVPTRARATPPPVMRRIQDPMLRAPVQPLNSNALRVRSNPPPARMHAMMRIRATS